MAINLPGPYEIEIDYTFNSITHLMRYNCTIQTEPTVGDDFSTVIADTRSGGTLALDTAIDNFIAVFKATVNDQCTIGGATLWKYATGTYDRTYKGVYSIAQVGTAAIAPDLASQMIFTFRTFNGGRMRANILEGIGNGSTVTQYGQLSGAGLNFANHFLDDDCIFHARDNTFAALCLRALAGQNEALFKRRYR